MIGPQDIWVGLALGTLFFGAEKLQSSLAPSARR